MITKTGCAYILHSLLFFSFKGIKVDVLEKILELGKLISGKRNALANS